MKKKINININNFEDSYIKICIIDNGIGRVAANKLKEQKSLKRESLGLKITHERLTNFYKSYQNNYSLKFKDLYDENNLPLGTKVILKLPLK